MAVVRSDHEVALFPWECPDRGHVGVDQRSQDFRQDRLCGALLARNGQQRKWTSMLQRPQQPGNHQDLIIPCWKIEERCKRLYRSASLRDGQRQHAGGAPEAHRRVGRDTPSLRPYLNGLPAMVREIQVDAAFMLGDANVNRTLWGVELGAR